jgi:hypothetical protein
LFTNLMKQKFPKKHNCWTSNKLLFTRSLFSTSGFKNNGIIVKLVHQLLSVTWPVLGNKWVLTKLCYMLISGEEALTQGQFG